MSTYQGIRGLKVRDYTTNPDDPLEGQLWYNKTDQVGKYQIPNVTSAWRTGNDMNVAQRGGGSNGPQTSGIAVSKSNPSPSGATELYDGTSWTEVNDLNTNRRGVGTCAIVNTAAIAFGGEQSPSAWYTINESWNGSNWTEVNDLNTGRVTMIAIGSSTAGLALGGVSGTTANYQKNESWNGTSFSETNDMNTGRYGTGAGAGTQTSGLAWTEQSDYAKDCESWNGSAWTAVANLNTEKIQDGGGGDSNTTALSSGGMGEGFVALAKTELWNGTAWTEVNDLSLARGYQYNGGNATAGWNAGGYLQPGAFTAQTEEWNANQPIGAWTTSTAMNTARYNIGNVGVYNAALGFGGRAPSIANNESWNGSSWTELNDLNTARHSFLGGSGTTTSALAMGGENGGYTNKVEEWNGSSWTETTDLNTTRGEGGGSGASAEAALAFSGTSSSYTQMKTETESWNGSSWTEVNDVNTARFQGVSGLGRTYTAALWIAGRNTPGSFLANSEQYNGSTWTETNDINTARLSAAGQTGSSTSAFIAGGNPPYTGKTEDWNGVSWQETSDMNTARGSGSGGAAADITQGLVYGGYTGTAATTATEEWSSTSNLTKTISTD